MTEMAEILTSLREAKNVLSVEYAETFSFLIERNLISEPIKVPGSKVVNYLVNPKAQRKSDDKA